MKFANKISSNTHKLLSNVNSMLTPDPVPSAPQEEIKEAPKVASTNRIPLTDAKEKGTFSFMGRGVYKEAATPDKLSQVWIKKEITDEKTGEKQEWLVAYTNEEEDLARAIATKKLAAPGDYALIEEVQMNGEPGQVYPVDESQMVSNAGDAMTYDYNGNKYEIVVWNEQAQEHMAGEKSINNLGPKEEGAPEMPVRAKLEKEAYFPERGEVDELDEQRRMESELDEFCPTCGEAMQGTSDEYFLCMTCQKAWDARELEEMNSRQAKMLFVRKANEFGIDALQEVEEPTTDPFGVATHDGEVMDGAGTAISMGSIVLNEFGKKGEVTDILSPTTVTVSWLDKHYSANERGETIYPGDITVVAGFKKKALHPAVMRDYEAPMPDLQIDDVVRDNRTNNVGLVTQVDGEMVQMDTGTQSMKVPIGNIEKMALRPGEKYNPDYGHGNITWFEMYTIPEALDLHGTDKFVAYVEEVPTEGGMQYAGVIDDANTQETVSGETFPRYEDARKFIAAEIAAIKDANAIWADSHISDSIKELRKKGAQPKPEDIPIAPGIKSKNITMDESGGQGTAKVTVDFTDVDQGLKFYQEEVGQPQAAPAPAPAAETPAPTEEKPAQPAAQPPGPPTPMTSALNFKLGMYDEDDIMETPNVGSFEWVSKVVEEADKQANLAGVIYDEDDYINHIYTAAEDESGYCDDRCAISYWRNYQKKVRTRRVASLQKQANLEKIKQAVLQDAKHNFLIGELEGEESAWNDFKQQVMTAISTDQLIMILTDTAAWYDADAQRFIGKLEGIYSEAFQDNMPGGLADDMVPEDFNQISLTKGVHVEMEHTSNPDIAIEIAMDHLKEDPLYYDKLETIE